MNIVLLDQNNIEEISIRIKGTLKDQNINLFLKCEFLKHLMEFSVKNKQDDNLFQFLTSNSISLQALKLIFVDIEKLESHFQEILKYNTAFTSQNVVFEGIKQAINRYQLLEGAPILKQFKYKWELNSISEFKNRVLEQYKNQKFIIVVSYKILKIFYNKFVQDKHYFTQMQCIIRVVDFDNQNSQDQTLSDEQIKNNICLKFYKYFCFKKNCANREYRLFIDNQIFSIQEYQFIKRYYNELSPSKLQQNSGIKIKKQMTTIFNDLNIEYNIDLKNISNINFFQYPNIRDMQYYYNMINSVKSDFSDIFQLARLLSITKTINHIVFYMDSQCSFKHMLNEEQNSDSLIKVQIELLNYLFSLNKIQKATIIIDYKFYSEQIYKLFTIFEQLPSNYIILKDQQNQFQITIRQNESIINSNLELISFDKIIMKQIAYEKKHLVKQIKCYQNIIQNSILLKEKYANMDKNNQEIEKILMNQFTQFIQPINYLNNLKIQRNIQIKLESFLEILDSILQQNKFLKSLEIEINQQFSELNLYSFYQQIIESIKQNCDNLQSLNLHIDNPEQTIDIIKHFNYKLQFINPYFKIYKEIKKDIHGNDETVLSFILFGNYISVFEKVFEEYKKQFESELNQYDIQQKNLEKNSKLDQIDQNKKSSNPQIIKYSLVVFIQSEKQFSKMQWFTTKFIDKLDYIQYLYDQQEILSKIQDAYYIINIENYNFYEYILPKNIKNLIIQESWGRIFVQLLDMIIKQGIIIDTLQIKLSMYSFDENLQCKLRNIKYNKLKVDIWYDFISHENFVKVYESLQKNNFFNNINAIEKVLELQYQFQNLNEEQVIDSIDMISAIQNNQFKMNGTFEGRKNFKNLLIKKYKHLFNNNSYYKRVYTSYKCLKLNAIIQKNFRLDIIAHICEMY